jgi:hypothetical protein
MTKGIPAFAILFSICFFFASEISAQDSLRKLLCGREWCLASGDLWYSDTLNFIFHPAWNMDHCFLDHDEFDFDDSAGTFGIWEITGFPDSTIDADLNKYFWKLDESTKLVIISDSGGFQKEFEILYSDQNKMIWVKNK